MLMRAMINRQPGVTRNVCVETATNFVLAIEYYASQSVLWCSANGWSPSRAGLAMDTREHQYQFGLLGFWKKMPMAVLHRSLCHRNNLLMIKWLA